MAFDYEDAGTFGSEREAKDWAQRNKVDLRDLHIPQGRGPARRSGYPQERLRSARELRQPARPETGRVLAMMKSAAACLIWTTGLLHDANGASNFGRLEYRKPQIWRLSISFYAAKADCTLPGNSSRAYAFAICRALDSDKPVTSPTKAPPSKKLFGSRPEAIS
ncbi:hypothetical protein BSY18_3872 (plasmid) [Blastomonas sp. RAC04]|nr:hypothetical protein BSY18_3872 [Blastomonas sp. RAC04]